MKGFKFFWCFICGFLFVSFGVLFILHVPEDGELQSCLIIGALLTLGILFIAEALHTERK